MLAAAYLNASLIKLIISADTNFPGPDSIVVSSNPGWLANGPDSRWIAPKGDQSFAPGTAGNAPGDYAYQISFDLSGFNLGTVKLTGQWAVDSEGVDILITLTEELLPRSWIDGAGLMGVHVPIADMDAPGIDQIEHVMAVIQKAKNSNMGVAVHCLAGLGRTGTMLAAYFVEQGNTSTEAIRKVRELRPGSIEVRVQEEAIRTFERSRHQARG